MLRQPSLQQHRLACIHLQPNKAMSWVMDSKLADLQCNAKSGCIVALVLRLTPLRLTPLHLYALRLGPYALRLTPYALRLTPYALCLMPYALRLTPHDTPGSSSLRLSFFSSNPPIPQIVSQHGSSIALQQPQCLSLTLCLSLSF